MHTKDTNETDRIPLKMNLAASLSLEVVLPRAQFQYGLRVSRSSPVVVHISYGYSQRNGSIKGKQEKTSYESSIK